MIEEIKEKLKPITYFYTEIAGFNVVYIQTPEIFLGVRGNDDS